MNVQLTLERRSQEEYAAVKLRDQRCAQPLMMLGTSLLRCTNRLTKQRCPLSVGLIEGWLRLDGSFSYVRSNESQS